MAKIRKNLGIHKVFSKYLEYIKNSRTISKYPLNAVLHISKKCCTFARRHHFSKFWDKNTQSSPPSAQANRDYTLIWLNIKFILLFFIFPKLKKKSIKFIHWHCLYVCQYITEPTLWIFTQHLASSKQWVHHCSFLAGIQILLVKL